MRKILKYVLPMAALFGLSGSLVYGLTKVNIFAKKISFANYDGYIEEEKVFGGLQNKFDFNFHTFSIAHEAVPKFKSGDYDLMINTDYVIASLIKEGFVEKLNWERFNIPNIHNADDALKIFTPDVQKILQHYDLDGDRVPDNMLNYSIPYFLQDLIFAYSSTTENEKIKNSKTWNEILDNSAPTNSELKNLYIIDDYKNMSAIGNLMSGRGVNVKNDSESSEAMNNIKGFLRKWSSTSVQFMGDSMNVLNRIAKFNNSGAILYNGDALYAASGGDDFSEAYFANNNELQDGQQKVFFARPEKTSVILDLMIIYKFTDESYKDNEYSIMKQLLLSGMEKTATDEGCATNADDEYINLAMINFDYLNYVSPLQSIQNCIGHDLYFGTSEIELRKKQMYTLNEVTPEVIEEPIDDILSSTLLQKYLDMKLGIW